jgi:steroid delta-isomerase-like uncharacterized protein
MEENMSEENKALVRRAFDEMINKKNLSAVDRFIATDYVGHFSGVPEPIRGIEAFKQFIGMYNSAIPDSTVSFDTLIAEGDRVVARLTYRGTHKGALMGIPPSGKPVNVTASNIFRIVNGKAAEQWAINDDAGMMVQIGVMPAPGAAH